MSEKREFQDDTITDFSANTDYVHIRMNSKYSELTLDVSDLKYLLRAIEDKKKAARNGN